MGRREGERPDPDPRSGITGKHGAGGTGLAACQSLGVFCKQKVWQIHPTLPSQCPEAVGWVKGSSLAADDAHAG